MQGGWIGGGGGDDNRVVHRTLRAERLHDVGHGGTLLSDRHIDAIDRIPGLVVGALVDDRVDGYGGLAGLTVADDEFPLATANRDHRVDRHDSGLERLGDGLTEYDTRSLALKRHLRQVSFDLAESVKRNAKRIDHSSEHLLTDLDGGDPSGSAYRHSLLDLIGRAEKHGSDIVLLKVHHNAHHSALEFEQFSGLGVGQAIHSGDTVADLQHLADFLEVEGCVNVLQLLQKHLGDFTWFYVVHTKLFFCSFL